MPGFSTRAIQAASRIPETPQPPLNVPIYASSTFEVADAAELGDLLVPGLPSHPQHALAARTLRDGMGGGMLAIELSGGRPHGERFLERVRVAVHATSLGGVETLVSHPASSSHRQLTDDELAAAGMTPGTIRISIVLEDADDLIEDLVAAARLGA